MPPKSSSTKLHRCTCVRYGCNKQKIVVGGTTQPGKWVTHYILQKHRTAVGVKAKRRLGRESRRDRGWEDDGSDLRDSDQEDPPNTPANDGEPFDPGDSGPSDAQDSETYAEEERAETESEISDLAQEDALYANPDNLEELRQELSKASEDTDTTPRAHVTDNAPAEGSMEIDLESSVSGSAVFTPRTSPAPAGNDSNSDSDDDEENWEDSDDEMDEDDLNEYTGAAVFGNFKVPKSAREKIQMCIKEISLPSWVTRLPDNLGEKKHGKLTADQYLTLFTAILPMVIPETQLAEDEETNSKMCDGFYNLVAATNILSSFKTSDSETEAFTEYFVKYRQLTQNTFPDIVEPPNAHYGLHWEDIMKYWGPPPAIAEFWGERLNGDLQKIKTNRRLEDMDFTMLRQISRSCRLLALLHRHEFKNTTLRNLSALLARDSVNSVKAEMDDVAVSVYLGKAPRMSTKEYQLLLAYLNVNNAGYLSWLDMAGRDPDYHAMVLPPNANRLRRYSESGRTYSCSDSHRANSLIQYYIPNSDEDPATGVIDSILELPLDGFLRTFMLVRPHRLLDLAGTPYARYPNFMTSLVATEPSKKLLIIEPKHIITHLAAWTRPSSTYSGMKERFMVVCWALNRGRK
ncbi:hypothetical protein MKEN_00013900 [Mycena kentingensis (nom. inval.)]|nr:hypothetical protein MKEN_00013900 [Mycena kentingensis (nom. inval.)]